MGVRAVVCAIVLGGLVFLAPSESVLAGCNPNLAWQDRYPSWAAGTIAFERERWVRRRSGARRHGFGGREAPPLVARLRIVSA
jgi:hypothetical protein